MKQFSDILYSKLKYKKKFSEIIVLQCTCFLILIKKFQHIIYNTNKPDAKTLNYLEPKNCPEMLKRYPHLKSFSIKLVYFAIQMFYVQNRALFRTRLLLKYQHQNGNLFPFLKLFTLVETVMKSIKTAQWLSERKSVNKTNG